MQRIAIVQKYIPQYRAEFYNQLRTILAEKNIEIRLLVGQPSRRDLLKKDSIILDWAIPVRSKIFEIGQSDYYWQPVLPYLKNVDLVIVEQANKMLVNTILWLQNLLGIRKLAFWGHGRNFHEDSTNRVGEWVKKLTAPRVHWWFAYNQKSLEAVQQTGFPLERITCVQNSVDTKALNRALHDLTQVAIDEKRRELKITGYQVGLFIGGLNHEKNIPFLIEALHRIKEQLPEFEMLFIGNGMHAPLIMQAAKQHKWIHFTGEKFGFEKVPYFALAKYLLMPFSAGLVVLDSFALETPLVTIDSPNHGPEISYLENGVNGVMVSGKPDPQKYANEVVSIMNDEDGRNRLVDNCQKAIQLYSIEKMVENFASGVEQALMVKR